MKQASILSIIAVGALMAACDSGSGGSKTQICGIPTTTTIELSGSERVQSEAFCDFAWDLIGVTTKYFDGTDANVSVSPLSAAVALSMAANGGDDAVAANVAEVLGFDNLDVLNSTTNKLLRFLPSEGNRATMALANSAWINDSYEIVPDFRDCMNRTFYAEVSLMDFKQSTTADAINSWCYAKTGGLIPSIVEDVNEMEVFHLINALYFTSYWKVPFKPEFTEDASFHGTKAKTKVPMMYSFGVGRYVETDDICGVVLDFEGDYRMTFVLPAEGESTADLAGRIDADVWTSLMESRFYNDVQLTLPKFTTESAMGSFEKIMEKLGLKTSDLMFSKMVVKTSRPMDMKIVQKNYVSIDEYGAKMASVTDVSGEFTSPGPGEIVEMKFDRPFMYVVENVTTRQIVMAGSINNL